MKDNEENNFNFLIGTLGICTYNTRAHDNNKFCDFSSTKKILYEKELKDFLGNLFILYELENGYAIYSVENETKNLLKVHIKAILFILLWIKNMIYFI